MERIAVFARNHADHLTSACDIAKHDPGKPVPLRSSKLWARAKKALDNQTSAKIYFSTVGGDGAIEYEAVLRSVYLNPKMEDEEVQNLLQMSTSSTAGEGLWVNENEGAKTLYVISDCREVSTEQRLHMTDLIKVSDRTPISANFKYSYSPVFEVDQPELTQQTFPDEIVGSDTYPEGSARKVIVNAYERNPAARKACIAHYGCKCAVCDMNFENVYGSLGSGFIHVHHLKMLSKIGQRYEIDPVSDLIPVCPNCHAMLHAKQGDPYSVEELRVIVQENRTTP